MQIKKFENYKSREEMCDVRCRMGYDMKELDNCSNQELENMCKTDPIAKISGVAWTEDHNMENTANEAKKWIQKAIKKPGALKKSMGKSKDEKLSTTEIDSELKALKSKDKDKSKEGVQGLSKKDLTKYRRLNLAKTLQGLKEHQEVKNYMFFGNLENMKRYIDEMMKLPQEQVDKILTEHDWASDHISVACENLEHVHNFLLNHGGSSDSHIVDDEQPKTNISKYNDFKNQ